jgi:hypothetical protein
VSNESRHWRFWKKDTLDSRLKFLKNNSKVLSQNQFARLKVLARNGRKSDKKVYSNVQDIRFHIYGVKGIVSRKFDMLLLVPLDRYKHSTPFLLYPFLKISTVSSRIFDYKMFSGIFLLGRNSVNDNSLTSL